MCVSKGPSIDYVAQTFFLPSSVFALHNLRTDNLTQAESCYTSCFYYHFVKEFVKIICAESHTTIEGDDEVKSEQDDDTDPRDLDDDDPGDVDESEIFFNYGDSYSPSALEMKDPLQQSGDDDEEFPFCITPHAAKRRKMRPTEEIRATRER